MTVPPPVPAPVPPDADLSDFRFMPLEVARLRRSKAWLICKRRPELAFYIINLFAAAWHERPAGSLEDDDDVLADAAMCPPERWPEVRADVLRGWFKAADGRLYHPTVAEKVNEAWRRKAEQRQRTQKARAAAIDRRLRQVQSQPDEDRVDLSPTEPVAGSVTGSVTATKGEGEGERQGQGDSRSSEPCGSGGAPPAGSELARMVFRQGVDWLRGVTGKPDAQCRSLIGRWRKSTGDAVLIELLAEAQRQDIQSPEAWITAAIKARERAEAKGAMPASAAEAMDRFQADPAWRGVAA